MNAHLWGGPCHLATIEVEAASASIMLVIGEDDDDMANMKSLIQIGITPRAGTSMAKYKRIDQIGDDCLFGFAGLTGDPDKWKDLFGDSS